MPTQPSTEQPSKFLEAEKVATAALAARAAGEHEAVPLAKLALGLADTATDPWMRIGFALAAEHMIRDPWVDNAAERELLLAAQLTFVNACTSVGSHARATSAGADAAEFAVRVGDAVGAARATDALLAVGDDAVTRGRATSGSTHRDLLVAAFHAYAAVTDDGSDTAAQQRLVQLARHAFLTKPFSNGLSVLAVMALTNRAPELHANGQTNTTRSLLDLADVSMATRDGFAVASHACAVAIIQSTGPGRSLVRSGVRELALRHRQVDAYLSVVDASATRLLHVIHQTGGDVWSPSAPPRGFSL